MRDLNKDFDVIVIGELNVDLILNEIDSFPEMGKEKLAGEMTLSLGSSAAIFASNLSVLGATVGFIGKIGKDSFGDLVIESLNNKKVNTDLIIKDDTIKTGATIVMNFNEDRAMITHPGAMEKLSIKDINIDDLKKSKHLHFSSFFLQPGIKNDITNLFRIAKGLGLTTSLDPQWDPAEKWDMDLKNLLPYVDVFLPNKLELLNLTKENKIENAINNIRNYANTVVVKNGNKGSIVFNEDEKITKEAFLNTKVVDAIGAGDSFDAGFINKYINGSTLEECQVFGNLMGAVSTTAAGGTGAFNSFENVKKVAREKFEYSVN